MYTGLYLGYTLDSTLNCTQDGQYTGCTLECTLHCTLGCTLGQHTRCALFCTLDVSRCVQLCSRCFQMCPDVHLEYTPDVVQLCSMFQMCSVYRGAPDVSGCSLDVHWTAHYSVHWTVHYTVNWIVKTLKQDQHGIFWYIMDT